MFKKFDLKRKIIIFCCAFIGMFSACFLSPVAVYAAPYGYDTFDNIKEQIPSTDIYFIHFTSYSRSNTDSSKVTSYDSYYFSREPLVFDKNNYCVSVGSYINRIYVNGKLTNSFSNPDWWYFNLNTTLYVNLEVDYTILDSNYDVKDVDGNVLFTRPLLTPEVLQPLVEETQGNSLVIVGGTICLIILGVCLAQLVTFLRRYLAQ